MKPFRLSCKLLLVLGLAAAAACCRREGLQEQFMKRIDMQDKNIKLNAYNRCSRTVIGSWTSIPSPLWWNSLCHFSLLLLYFSHSSCRGGTAFPAVAVQQTISDVVLKRTLAAQRDRAL